MNSDAKLGLLAGLAAVLLIAVVYHRRPQVPVAPTGVLPAPPQTVPLSPPPVSVVPRPEALAAPDLANRPAAADPLLRGSGD